MIPLRVADLDFLAPHIVAGLLAARQVVLIVSSYLDEGERVFLLPGYGDDRRWIVLHPRHEREVRAALERIGVPVDRIMPPAREVPPESP